MEKTLSAKASRKMYLPKISISIPTQLLIISLCFMALFVSTGLDKIWDVSYFQAAMSKSTLLAPFAKPLSYMVPIIEIIIAVLLSIPNLNKNKNQQIRINKIGLWASFILMSLFTVYTLYTLIAFNKNLPCTCGGVLKNLTWKQHLVFNFFFLSLAARAIYLMRKKKLIKSLEQ